jgi:predicted DNA-binding protein
MPAEKGNKKAVSIWIDKELDIKIEYLADKAGITKSKLLANMIEVTVEEIEAADKIGLLALARVFQDLRERTKKRFKRVTSAR